MKLAASCWETCGPDSKSYDDSFDVLPPLCTEMSSSHSTQTQTPLPAVRTYYDSQKLAS